MSKQKYRFNVTNIDPNKINETPQGGIVVEGVVIRTGVFTYETENGGATNEFLPADELFRPAVLSNLENAPVTNEHPDEMITTNNFKSNAIGVVTNVRGEGEKLVVADLIINDAETINQILEGDKRELSAGYFTQTVEKNGVSPSGERFDAIQKNIIFNHVAVVEMGRAGPDVSLRLNSAGDQVVDREDEEKRLLKQKSDKYKKKPKINDIREVDGEFCIFSKETGEKLECLPTREEAEDREKEIAFFKSQNERNKMSKNKTNQDEQNNNKENEHEEKENQQAAVLVQLSEHLAREMEMSIEDVVERLNQKREELMSLLKDEESMNGKENGKSDEEFNELVKNETKERLNLIVAAKQLEVPELTGDEDKKELQLKIAKVTNPNTELDNKSEDYIQALLDLSLDSVDIDSFWVKQQDTSEDTKASDKEQNNETVEEENSEDLFEQENEGNEALNSILSNLRGRSNSNKNQNGVPNHKSVEHEVLDLVNNYKMF